MFLYADRVLEALVKKIFQRAQKEHIKTPIQVIDNLKGFRSYVKQPKKLIIFYLQELKWMEGNRTNSGNKITLKHIFKMEDIESRIQNKIKD